MKNNGPQTEPMHFDFLGDKIVFVYPASGLATSFPALIDCLPSPHLCEQETLAAGCDSIDAVVESFRDVKVCQGLSYVLLTTGWV